MDALRGRWTKGPLTPSHFPIPKSQQSSSSTGYTEDGNTAIIPFPTASFQRKHGPRTHCGLCSAFPQAAGGTQAVLQTSHTARRHAARSPQPTSWHFATPFFHPFNILTIDGGGGEGERSLNKGRHRKGVALSLITSWGLRASGSLGASLIFTVRISNIFLFLL